MKPVLFIALEFPPLNNTGVHRSAKLAKYLREFGIDPIVVTLRAEDAAAAFGAPIEASLLDDLPPNLAVYRLPARPDRIPRTRLGRFIRVWARSQDPLAARVRGELSVQLRAIAQRHRPEAVYASLPPFSSADLAIDASRQLGVPLIADMRDGWSHWCAGAFASYGHWLAAYARERRLFQRAARVVTVTDELAEVFRASHPSLPRSRFSVVPNGFDGELSVPARVEVPIRPLDSTITVGYVGRFYYSPESRASLVTPWWRRPGHRKLHYHPVHEDWLYRSPHFFFSALAELRRRNPGLASRFRFELVGEEPPWLASMAREHGLEGAIVRHGRVSFDRVISLASRFDAQLCTSVKVLGGRDYALASKTFDYVRAGRPILGLVTPGAQRSFLERSGMALVADPDDLDACVATLEKLGAGGFALQPDRAFLAGYHRRATAEQMATIIHSVSAQSHSEFSRHAPHREHAT